ncbi:MAG: glycosyltransferase family 4 protein [Deltaproteobacteria bacterium]|nr:glycosyltransferase family 4 protein [Deltaproteobacteria bacterium]
MSTKLRVLHLAEGAAFAGIETHLAALSHVFGPLDVNMKVALFADGPLSGLLRDADVEYRVFRRRWKFDPRPVGEIAAWLRAGADILHTHGYLADVYGRRAARAAGKPHVATVHGHPEPFRGFADWKMRWYMRLDRRALSSAAAVIAVSETLAEDLSSTGVPRERIHVIENGLRPSVATEADIQALRKNFGDGPVVGFVGRFDPVKAPLRFVQTAHRILNAHPTARFLLAGDGPLLGEAKSAAGASGRDKAFSFLGFRNDVDAVIGACDFLLMPSDSEGVPQVLLAAMRDGAVPVCSAVGGIPAVLDGFEDCLAPPRAEELADRLSALIQDGAKAASVRQSLKKRFQERYTAETMASRVAGLYRSLT